MTISLARLGRLLDLDRPIPGERTTWTVRTEHSVHTVELEQAVTGTSVTVDGIEVGRTSAWSFPGEPFRFTVGAAAGILVLQPDTGRGTLRVSLLVGGVPVAQDLPSWRKRAARPVPWGRILALTGYALGAVLVAAAAVGDPFRGFVTTAIGTAMDVAWIAAVRGIDPFGVLPGWVRAFTASRAGTLLTGIELLALVTIARDPRLHRRVPLLDSASRVWRVVGWCLLLLAAAIAPTLLDS